MLKKIEKLRKSLTLFLGKIHWKQKGGLTQEDKENIIKLLTPDYYIILTRRNNHLSTYLISFLYFLMTGKFGYYSHALMNLENEVTEEKDFRLIEATGIGVHYTPFDQVFNCHSVALLKPKGLTLTEWTEIMDKARTELGKPYDTLFDLKSDKELSCVELVRISLQALPDYNTKFANFEKLIKKYKNLHPQMFRDCSDFEVVYEIKR
jgi:hypothetical protein